MAKPKALLDPARWWTEEESAAVTEGYEAYSRLAAGHCFEDWVSIAHALSICVKSTLSSLGANSQRDQAFRSLIIEVLTNNGLGDFAGQKDAQVRYKLTQAWERIDEVRAWYEATFNAEKRLRKQHLPSLYMEFIRAEKKKGEGEKPKPPHGGVATPQQLKAENVTLIANAQQDRAEIATLAEKVKSYEQRARSEGWDENDFGSRLFAMTATASAAQIRQAIVQLERIAAEKEAADASPPDAHSEAEEAVPQPAATPAAAPAPVLMLPAPAPLAEPALRPIPGAPEGAAVRPFPVDPKERLRQQKAADTISHKQLPKRNRLKAAVAAMDKLRQIPVGAEQLATSQRACDFLIDQTVPDDPRFVGCETFADYMARAEQIEPSAQK